MCIGLSHTGLVRFVDAKCLGILQTFPNSWDVEAPSFLHKKLDQPGLYPGDPGPPGADSAGTVLSTGSEITHIRSLVFVEFSWCMDLKICIEK